MMKRRALLWAAAALLASAVAVAPAVTASASTPAPPPSAWPSWDYDFGTTASSHTFTYTNITSGPVVDKPVPFTYPQVFHLTSDTCTVVVPAGHTCTVTVAFTPVSSLGPIFDALKLAFTSSGHPIATPPVTLFAQNAGYVYTAYPNGYVMFPNTVHTGGTPTAVRPGIVRPDDPTSVSIYYMWHWIWPWPPTDWPIDFTGGPFSVASNTCVNVTSGMTSCQLTINFQPATTGTFSTPLQMSFENPMTGGSVVVQSLTLIGTGV